MENQDGSGKVLVWKFGTKKSFLALAFWLIDTFKCFIADWEWRFEETDYCQLWVSVSDADRVKDRILKALSLRNIKNTLWQNGTMGPVNIEPPGFINPVSITVLCPDGNKDDGDFLSHAAITSRLLAAGIKHQCLGGHIWLDRTVASRLGDIFLGHEVFFLVYDCNDD